MKISTHKNISGQIIKNLFSEKTGGITIKETETTKRKLFALFYAKKREPTEAAILAGIPQNKAAEEGLQLLQTKAVRTTLEKIDDTQTTKTVKAGLERLAFGRANDAVQLVFSDEMPTPHKLNQLDLFNVSEIKRVKGGGVEVKLFDRQKALEKLLELDSRMNSESSAESFFKALKLQAEENENNGSL